LLIVGADLAWQQIRQQWPALPLDADRRNGEVCAGLLVGGGRW